ncbi:12992_t:CDS:2 [Funneliformis caledonium]|uniref:12992_t:CDS:1 n=1 Tax=Funneliformis caledonium TaxID=1117310 RepID=A0A9N9FVQ0_9GLOM|nr:12992_t:CDS:2 [Funneliformis caledonium]
MCSKVDEAIKSYLEMHRPASWSYNYFLKNNKPLIIEELNGSPWPDKSSLWKKDFIRIAQQMTSEEKFIDKVMYWFKENAGSVPAKRCRRSCGYRPVIIQGVVGSVPRLPSQHSADDNCSC